MAGKCVLCNNLISVKLSIDNKDYDCGFCNKGKYSKEEFEGYFTMTAILKLSKAIKDIEEKCDSWDDRLKPKKVEVESPK